jgi:hypothetical protein
MVYPRSPSLQTLPVPGVGFCQTIFVDQDVLDRAHFRNWSLTPGGLASTGWTQEPAEPPATAYRLQ